MTAVAYETPLRERRDVRFAVHFAMLTGVVLVAWPATSPTWDALRTITARIVVFVTNLTGLPAVEGPGDVVTFSPSGRSPFSYRVADECTGAAVMATYLVAVAAYPVSRRRRLVGAAGLPLLALLNIVRLVMLGWVGAYAPGAFEAVHLYWWQAFYVAGTGAVWFAWVWFVADGARASGLRQSEPLARGIGARVRTFAPVAATMLGTLVLMAAVGSWLGAARAYATALLAVRMAVADVLFADSLSVTWAARDELIVEYGLLAAVVALFAGAPAVALRQRARGALTVGLPITFVLQVASSIAFLTFRVNGLRGSERVADDAITPVMVAAHLGVVLVVWQIWRVREHLREQQRQARRRELRHGPTHRLAKRPAATARPRGTHWVEAGTILPRRSTRRR